MCSKIVKARRKKIATKLQAKLQTNPSKNEYCKELLRIAFESGIFYQKKQRWSVVSVRVDKHCTDFVSVEIGTSCVVGGGGQAH